MNTQEVINQLILQRNAALNELALIKAELIVLKTNQIQNTQIEELTETLSTTEDDECTQVKLR